MRIRVPTLVATAAVALLVPLAVLGQSPGPEPSGSPAPATSGEPTLALPLEGVRWHLREFRNEDGGMAGASDDGWIRLVGGVLTGSTGCNDLSGSYELDGDTLTLANLTPTEASCLDGDLVAQEMAVLGRLPQVVSFAFEPARGKDATDLVLIDAAEGRHLTFRSIQGRTWVPLYGGAEPMPEGFVTVRFEHGAASGQGPCNTFAGPFHQEDLGVAIGPLESSRSSCPDLGLENEFLSDLQVARSYAFDSGDLVLLDEQGSALRPFTEASTGD